MNPIKVPLFAITLLIGLWGCSRYPNTAEQAGAVGLGLQGKNIAYALTIFHQEHNRWPQALSDLVQSGLIASEELLYPRTYDLGDRRDLLKIDERIEWIYLPPKDGAPDMPLLMAPLPYTSSMGKRLAEPKRIIVKRDTTVEWLNEHETTEIIRTLART